MNKSSSLSPKLGPEQVEMANAYGPYTHGTWEVQGLHVGNEESLAGRGEFLVRHIREAIIEKFKLAEIENMTLVDVGCYDGWIICQLEDLPFKKIIGIEPRKKNLDKGRLIRDLLGIETRCEFRQGSIENLDEVLADEKADVVICTGLFHHLSSTADGVSALHSICRKFLFMETICLPAMFEDERLKKALELKDLPYFFGSQAFGLTGHKLESGYYDGSATQMAVVSLPSVETLRMYLEVGGFTSISIEVDPESYARQVAGGGRSFSAVCISAEPEQDRDDSIEWIEQYERGIISTLLPIQTASALYEYFTQNGDISVDDGLANNVIEATTVVGTDHEQAQLNLQETVGDKYALEILKNIRHSPEDKTALEYGKCLLSGGDYDAAKKVLFKITQRLNADWRSVYRAFVLLSWLYRISGETERAEHYAVLCKIANPQYPKNLIETVPAFLDPVH